MKTNSQFGYYPILSPFAFLYGIVIWIRNVLFDWHLLPSEKYAIPVICVGNLAVGGTGKTPMVEYLIRLLSDKYRIAVLSRGYKRKSSGYVIADENSTAWDIGDEACQIKRKYPYITVAVDKNRRRGMRNLLALPHKERPQVVLLDDGFQHRYVKPSLSILVTDYNRLFFDDRLLPAGRLREPAKSASRADIIVVSKCPENYDPIDFLLNLKQMMHYLLLEKLYFTRISYQPLQGVFPKACNPLQLNNIRKDDDITLVTGIANPTPLIEEIQKYSDKVNVISFPDHHAFTQNDFKKIESELSKTKSNNPLIICTEKDAARFRNNPQFPEKWKSRIYYLPIQTHFLIQNHQKQFDREIMQHISTIYSTRR